MPEKQSDLLPIFCDGANVLKFCLMPFVCFLSFGFPTQYGNMVASLSGFAPICFYVLSGFFVLTGDETQSIKLRRAAVRHGIMFAALFVCFLATNLLYFFFTDIIIIGLFSKRVLFNFFALGIWPFDMGESIWFIQSMFYAYLFLLIIDKFGLMKYYKRILIALAVIYLLGGEFSWIFGMNIFGYTLIPSTSALTALVFILCGALMREYSMKLFELPDVLYIVIIIIGLVVAFFEFSLLTIVGQLNDLGYAIGFAITAFGAVGLAIVNPEVTSLRYIVDYGRLFSKIMYAVCQPVGFAIIVTAQYLIPQLVRYIQEYGSLIIFFICLGAMTLFFSIKDRKPIEET